MKHYWKQDSTGQVFSRGSKNPFYFLCVGDGRFISAKNGEWREQRLYAVDNLNFEIGLPMEWVAKQWGVGAKEAGDKFRSYIQIPKSRASTQVKHSSDVNNETREQMSGLWEYEMTMRAFNRRHRYREITDDFSRENHPLCQTDAFVSSGKPTDNKRSIR